MKVANLLLLCWGWAAAVAGVRAFLSDATAARGGGRRVEVSRISPQPMSSFRIAASTRPEPQSSLREVECNLQMEEEAVGSYGDPRTWGEAMKVFTRHETPRFIAIVVLAFLFSRIQAGPIEIWDLLLAAACVPFWACQEYILHKFLLHSAKPWFGSQIHNKHHETEYFHVCIDPLPLVAAWIAVVSILAALVFPLPGLAITWMISYCVMGMMYELTHYIAHLRISPAELTAFWQDRRAHHAYHHLRDSSMHWAFTAPDLDRLLGSARQEKL